ncbi:MAG: glycosyltransferase, partial [Clostridia bacterium]|nr:glycosyltransferase [Clostridia bacterium]
DPDKMLIGIVSRLTDQKGFDLIAYKLEELCQNNGCQIVVLGTGEEQYENLFRHYSWKYPDILSAQITYSNEMSHKFYAACDAFLMPSAFEPCGLSQIISMKYGTLPIVRETGGLKDTVKPYNQYTGEGYGFSFANYNADEMLGCIYTAMDVYYNNKPQWIQLARQAMAADYSWDVSADKYISLYSDITGIKVEKRKETK